MPFHGWQLQPNVNTVQLQVNTALGKLFGEQIRSTGCGRTDTGVHASEFFLHFNATSEPREQLVFKLNKMLPQGIAVHRLINVDEKAHTRYDATERTYQYYIHFKKDPFLADTSYSYQFPKPDFLLVQKAAAVLIGNKSFESLCRINHDAKTTICDVRRSEWEELANGQWRFTIVADRFLRSMVRMCVGACLTVGQGKLSLEELERTIQQEQRFSYLQAVPGHGLYLSKVEYPYL